MKDDCFLWFLIIFVTVAACIVCYKNGYAEGYKLGSAACPVIYPHAQTGSDSPDPLLYPRKENK